MAVGNRIDLASPGDTAATWLASRPRTSAASAPDQ